jgi:hypothetical protein
MKALNRIVTALLAIAVFPVAYFTDLITVYMHATIYDSNIVENLSVKRIIELFTGDGLFAGVFNKDNMSEIPEVLLKFKGNFIAFAVCFALALLIALAIIIVAAATNSRKTTAALGAAGILCLIGMKIAFSDIAAAVDAGKLTLGSLTDMSFMNLFGKIVLVTMSTAPAVMTVLFLAILIWNVAFIVIDLGEEQPKKKAKHAKKK